MITTAEEVLRIGQADLGEFLFRCIVYCELAPRMAVARQPPAGHAPLAFIPGFCLTSLQKRTISAEAWTPPEGMELLDWTDDLEDFVDTAALVKAQNAIISVDTSVVRLAGAPGQPVWMLIRYGYR